MNPTLTYWAHLLALLGTEALVLVTAATVVASRSQKARTRRLLWLSTFITLVLVWIGELSGGRNTLLDRILSDRSNHEVTVTLGASGESDGADNGAAGADFRQRAVLAASSVRWWPGVVWLSGSLGCVGWGCWLQIRVARRHKRSERPEISITDAADALRRRMGLRQIDIRAWAGLQSPFVFGLFAPQIAWPSSFEERLDPKQRDAVLAHEIAHLAAHDPIWLTLSGVVCALAWWHPAVWWARRELQAAMEAAADEASGVVPGGRLALAESLVTLGRQMSPPRYGRGLGMAGVGRKSQLAQRVTRLLEPGEAWHPTTLWNMTQPAILGCLITVVILLIPTPGNAVSPLAPLLIAQARGAIPATTPTPHEPKAVDPVPVSSATGTALPGIGVPQAPSSEPKITLEIKAIEIREQDARGRTPAPIAALAALFARYANQETQRTTGHPTGDLPGAQLPDAENISIERSLLEGQTAVLDEARIRPLLKELMSVSGAEFIATPTVTTRSGQEAEVTIEDMMNLVTGVGAQTGGLTNTPSVQYRTAPLGTGLTVGVLPVRVGDAWHVEVNARTTEFLGYDDPGHFVPAGQAAGTQPLQAVIPLPRLRVRDTKGESRLARGESLVLRGAEYTTQVKIPGNWLRKERTRTEVRRVYLVVTPVLAKGG